MKTLICLTLLSFTTICNSQTTIYGTIAPGDRALGLRLDQQIIGNFGLSASASTGKYPCWGEFKKHQKIAFGGCLLFNELMLSGRACYHKYGQNGPFDEFAPKNTLKPLSYEIGIGKRIGRFCYALDYDHRKGDFTVCFGYLIKLK